jgi:hypothetical protein
MICGYLERNPREVIYAGEEFPVGPTTNLCASLLPPPLPKLLVQSAKPGSKGTENLNPKLPLKNPKLPLKNPRWPLKNPKLPLQVVGTVGVAVPLRDPPPGDQISRTESLHPHQSSVLICYRPDVSTLNYYPLTLFGNPTAVAKTLLTCLSWHTHHISSAAMSSTGIVESGSPSVVAHSIFLLAPPPPPPSHPVCLFCRSIKKY